MKIRKFKDKDAKRVVEIIKRCDEEISSRDYSNEVIRLWSARLNADYIINKSKERLCFVVTEKSIVRGYISCENFEIKKLHIDPDYHKKGFGKKLIGAVEKILKERGEKKIVVQSSIGAKRFYEKCGFKKNRDIFEEESGIKFKLILMGKKIK